ncbi:Nn.00g007850.m01.CDS01 [Neocucurbitaria sp. VM-36]
MNKQPSISIESEIRTPAPQKSSPAYTVNAVPWPREPREPHFIGPTRSAFSFNIAETTLTRMGISTKEYHSIGLSSTTSSREATPEPALLARSPSVSSDGDCLIEFSHEEAIRLVGIYQEEIACVHPIIETTDLTANVGQILEMAKSVNRPPTDLTAIRKKDAHILRLAIATAMIHERHGKNEVSDRLVATIERDAGRISTEGEVGLKDIQIMGMLSLYFCHTSEELFAWRTIGCAARQCLEIGLHRKQSLVDNFKDENARKLAVQVFWVVYELDRRWSFGTSLSFALDDRDIDSQLPEPGNDYPYLKCMVAYARLCSRVWEALPPYGSSLQLIPKETEDYLDFISQNWLLSIPQELQFKHPRLGLATRHQPRQMHRLRTLLYLRGNYIRTLIHRHHVLTPDNFKADTQSAYLVVDIAKDSIQILVHLNETSDIYVREQSIYHYYLLSALAVVLLAVCHAPHAFAKACRDPFVSAVELVKGFSSHSTASRRLWRSIRGLLPVVKSLWQRVERGTHDQHHAVNGVDIVSERTSQPSLPLDHQLASDALGDNMPAPWTSNQLSLGMDLGSMPDIVDMSSDLLDLYDVFGSAAMHQPTQPNASTDLGEQGMSLWEIGEVSRHFQGLL